MAQLGQQFVRPDGSFDAQGYNSALFSVNPQAAMEMQQNQLRQQLLNAQIANEAIPKTDTINQGNNVITRQWNPQTKQFEQVGIAPRFKPEVSDKAQTIALIRAHGGTEEDVQRYLGISSASDSPDTWDAGLTPDQKNIVKGIANYQFPLSARFLQTPKNQMLVSRAQMINSDLNVPEYEQKSKFVKGLGDTSPTSAGGMVMSANAALGHLGDLLEIQKQLPNSDFENLNQLTNWASQKSNKGPSTALASWNSGVNLAAGELAKMVKGGVASEGEVNNLLAGLNPNLPASQRIAGLQTLGEFLGKKVDAIQQQRDSILKGNSPKTSLLDADGQNAMTNLFKAAGKQAPQFGAPSNNLSYGASNGAQGGSGDVSSIPTGAINMLKMNPKLRDQFDQKYGAGASAKILGGG